MKIINLAEPQWINVECDTKVLCDVMCIVTPNFSAKSWDIKNQTIQRMTKCPRQHIVKQGKCFLFSWFSSSQPQSKNMQHPFARRVRIFFQNLFETFKFLFIAISSQFPAILRPYGSNSSLMHTFSCKKYLTTFDCAESVVLISQAEGFVISVNSKKDINVGLNIFNCSDGVYIAFEHRCDGTTEDNTDEEFCSKTCSKTWLRCKRQAAEKWLE